MKKRLLSAFLVLAMVLTLLPVSAFAAPVAEGNGQTIAVDYWDQETQSIVGHGTAVAEDGAYNLNTSTLTNIPEGYELATLGDVNIGYGALVELRKTETASVVSIEKISTDVTMNIQFKDGDEVVAGGDYFVPAGVQNYSVLEKYVPAGYKMTMTGDFMAEAGGKLVVNVEKISTEVTMNIQFKDGDEVVAGGDYFVPAGVQNYSVLEKYVPAGYKMTMTGDFMAEAGGKLVVNVEKISTEVTMNIQFKDGDEVVAGGDYFVPAGVQNYSVLEKYVPAGYKMTMTGDFMAEAGGKLVVNVEKISTEVTMNIQFKDGDEVVAGGDYFVPAGVQNYSVLEKYVPAGYKMTMTGDFMAEAGGKLVVNVEKISTEVTMNIQFKDGDEVVAGGDYFVPAGVQNYSVLEKYVPAGYKMTMTGDFMAEAGGKLVVNVEKISTEVTMNIQFKDGDEVVAGGDYFVPAGVQNYSVLEKYVPEGYKMTVSGDFFAEEGGHLVVNIEKISTDVTMNIQFKDGDEVVAGGDYFVPAGVQNYSVLEKYVPEGYKMTVSGDFFAEEGGHLVVNIEKISTDVTMNIQFKDGDEVVAGGDYFVPAGVQNYSVLEKYVPEGYKMTVSGDFFAEEGGHLVVNIEKISTDVTMNIQFKDGDEVVAGGDYFVPAGVQNYSVLEKYVPEGYKMTVSGDFFAEEGGHLVVNIEKISTDVTMNIQFKDGDEVVAGGDYFVPAGVQNYSVLEKYVPEGYKMTVSGDFMAEEGGHLVVSIERISTEAADTKDVAITYYIPEEGRYVAGEAVTVAADANNVNTTTLADIPEGYEVVWTGDVQVTGHVVVEVRPASTKTVGLNYWDIVNNKQVAEGSVTVDADATNVNTSTFTDIPEGYELVWTGDLQINDGWIFVEVRPAGVKTVGVNYWDIDNNCQVKESSVVVDADAIHVNSSALTDIPAGYELVWTGDYRIYDGWIFVELRLKDSGMKTVGVNYWDVVNNEQVAEGSVIVDADATMVNTTTLTDVPAGYELVWLGDVQINDGWIYVEVRPAEDSKIVGLNYWDIVNNKQVAEGSVVVDADATIVNTSTFTDIPKGYELVWTGDLPIVDGWVWVEVRPVEDTKTVGLNYWDIVNDKQVAEGSLTVDADATLVNTSTFTDIPEGYELVWTGDLPIVDGWVWVEVRPVEDTKTVGLNYWDIVNDKQVAEGSLTVDADATLVNTSTFTDIPEGYELVWTGDLPIVDGWVWVEVRPAEDSKTVGLNYWDIVNDKQVAEGSLTVDADATLVNTSTFTDIPKGYELVWTGDLPIVDGWVWVEVRPVEDTKTVGLNYWDIVNDKQVAEGSLTVDADATLVNTSTFTDIPKGYELVWTGDLPIVDGWVWVEVRPVEDTKTVGLNYWDIVNDKQVAEGSLTVDADATLVNTSTFTDIPKGYELVWTGDLPIVDGWVWVEVRPVEDTKTVGLNYWDIVNDKQVAEGSLTVDADATLVNTSTFTDIPKGYELVWTGDLPIVDGWVWVEVRPAEDSKTVGLNYWDIVNDKQVAEGSLTVDADATLVNTSTFTDIPEGYELVWTGDLPIVDGWVWVEVRPAGVKTVGVNYWDIDNNCQVKESSVVVDADAIHVNSSALTDIPAGYELVWTGDYRIYDGWIFVELRLKDSGMKTIGVNYWDIVNDKQAGEGSVIVDADATAVNTTTLTDVPAGYEVVWLGDVQINDGWIFVEVRPAEDSKTVGLNYWDIVNDKQVAEGSLTVDADATLVNTSTFTDIPKGYELVWTGDLPIVDGWVWVEVRPVEDTKTVGLNYWDIVNDKQVAEGSLTVDADATLVNTSTFTDIPKGYELVWTGDLPIVDGWVWVEVRPVEDTKTVGLNYWDIVNDKQVAEGSLTVDADATLVNTSTFTDIPKGYELVWTGDLPIVDGWVWVEVRPVEDTKTVGLNYWDIVNDKQVAEGSLTVDADATLVNTSTFTDIPKGYELVWTGDLPIVDGWVWVEVRPVEDTKTVGLNYWDIVNDKQVAEGSLTVDADATLVNTSTFTDIPKGYELVWTGDLPIVDGWVWVEVRPAEDTPVEKLLLTYDANYGSNPETKVIGYEAGETAIIKGDLFGRKNYTFTGWNTDPDGDGKSYDRGDKLEMDEDITLYAQWKRVDNDDDNDRPSTGTRYTIDASASRGGDISPSGRVFVARGNDRTFRITADEGYVIDDVRVDGESVGAVRIYTFENVRRDHTIEVIFVPDGQQTVAYGPDDTGVSDWLNVDDHVSYLNGYPGGLFGPNDNMTRAEVAQMFYNLLLNQNVTVTVSFADVSADAWYAQAVNALASLGIVQGVGDGMFAPERTITRAEFTVIAMRFAELPTGGTNPFSDVRTSDWFYAQVVGAAQYGWITGYTNGTFGPNNTITRAEVTAIVNRMLSRSADEDFVDDNAAELVRFNDVSDTYWAYYDIMEATNSHEYEWDNNAEEWTDLA